MRMGLASCCRPGVDRASQAAPAPRYAQRRAFTLIELLVVIAIIAILAALLLPGLARIKELARRTECQSRMKQWAMALTMYKDDHEDEIPREGYHPFGNTYLNNWMQVRGNKQGPSEDIWYNALSRYMKVQAASGYFLVRPRFYERATMFHCPSARFPADIRYPDSFFPYFSIALNSQLIALPYIPTTRFSRIGYVSQTVLFGENRLEGEPKVNVCQPNDHLGQPAVWAYRFVPRHAGGGNLAFADSHVAWLQGYRVVESRGLGQGGPVVPPTEVRWELE